MKKYKPSLVRVPRKTLDEEILKSLGFKLYRSRGERAWRTKLPYYHDEIEVRLGDYPSSNPNCGMVGLHSPAHDVIGFDKNGKKEITKVGASTKYIAWYVDTPERLRKIIVSLTQQNI